MLRLGGGRRRRALGLRHARYIVVAMEAVGHRPSVPPARRAVNPGAAARAYDPGMLELRPSCECCDRDLPPDSPDARICTYECTFCADCVEERLGGVCPNCGGGFERRPVRPAAMLAKDPASTVRVFAPEGCEAAARA